MSEDKLTAAESVRSEVGNIAAIEGLRGIAVLWVLLFHYLSIREGKFADPFIALVNSANVTRIVGHHGFLGVDLFFLITGFLLTLPWFKHALEHRPAPSAREFYWRRARRILPAYYVQLAVLFFICVPLLHAALWTQATRYTASNLLLHIGFLHYTTPYSSASLSINGPLWTLALEMQYYLLLPLIALAFVRRPYATAVLMILLTAAWRVLAAFDLDPLIAIYEDIGRRWDVPETALRQLATTQLPGYLGHFALGILCGRAWLLTRAHRMKVTEAGLLAALFAGSLLGLYALLANAYPVQGERTWLLVPALMALAMWASVSMRPTWGTRILGFSPLALVGRISYSMYLYHLPALLLFNKYAPADLGIAAFPSYFVGIIAVSTLSFHYIERPFMQRVGRRVAKVPPPTSTQSNSSTTGW